MAGGTNETSARSRSDLVGYTVVSMAGYLQATGQAPPLLRRGEAHSQCSQSNRFTQDSSRRGCWSGVSPCAPDLYRAHTRSPLQPRLQPAPVLQWHRHRGEGARKYSSQPTDRRRIWQGDGHGATGCRRGRGHYWRSDYLLSGARRGAGDITRAGTTWPQNLEQLFCVGERVFADDAKLLRLRTPQRRDLSPPSR